MLRVISGMLRFLVVEEVRMDTNGFMSAFFFQKKTLFWCLSNEGKYMGSQALFRCLERGRKIGKSNFVSYSSVHLFSLFCSICFQLLCFCGDEVSALSEIIIYQLYCLQVSFSYIFFWVFYATKQSWKTHFFSFCNPLSVLFLVF